MVVWAGSGSSMVARSYEEAFYSSAYFMQLLFRLPVFFGGTSENGAESKGVLRKSTDLALHTEQLLWKEDKRLINDNSEEGGWMEGG